MVNDFSAPTALTDVVLIVEGNRLHISRNYLAHHSEVFYKMLLGEFIESHQQEVTLTVPENLKYDEFLAFLKVIYSPIEEVTAETCGFLLKLADFYQVEDVVQKCDKFLANDSTVPIIEKLLLVDKFKLLETMNACLNLEELKRPDFVRDFAKKPEYSELSDGFKVILFENALNSAVHKVVSRKVCKMADFSVPTPLTDVVLIVEGKRLHVSRNYLAHHSEVFHKMLLGEFIESQQQEVTLTEPEILKYDEFETLLKVIYPPHEEVTEDNYGFLLKLADFYQVEEVVQKCDKFFKKYSKVTMIEKLYLADKYKLMETKSACLNSVELKKLHFVHDLTKKPEYKEISAELKIALLENGLNSAENKISLLEELKNLAESEKNLAERRKNLAESEKNLVEREVASLEHEVESLVHEVASLEHKTALLENKLEKASNYYCIKCVHQIYNQNHGVKCPSGMHCNRCNNYFYK